MKYILTIIISLFTFKAFTLATPNQTLVFVHGANFNASSWDLLKNSLSEIKTKAVNLPGRNDGLAHADIDLDKSASKLCEELQNVSGKITLMAHSQGGAIVNQALGKCDLPNLTKVIYVAAVIPLDGEKVFAKLGKADEEHYFSGITFNESELSLLISDQEKFLDSFASDATPEQRVFILRSAVNEPAPIGDGIIHLNQSKFDTLKKYYVHTINDKIVSYPSQQKIIEGISFESTYQLASEHLPMVTKVSELSRIVREVLEN